MLITVSCRVLHNDFTVGSFLATFVLGASNV